MGDRRSRNDTLVIADDFDENQNSIDDIKHACFRGNFVTKKVEKGDDVLMLEIVVTVLENALGYKKHQAVSVANIGSTETITGTIERAERHPTSK